MSVLDELKKNYNYNLKRYYNGVKYIEDNPNTWDKWMPMLIDILEIIETLLDEIRKYQDVTQEEKLNGFEDMEG